MRILIGTPCNAGQLSMHFNASYSATERALEIPRQFVLRDIQNLERSLANPKGFNPEQLDIFKNQLHQLQSTQAYEIQLYLLGNESLLARGRNHIAHKAMTEGFDKLFFIDSDEGWHPQAFFDIITSPYPITAGVVPLKTFPIVLNYLPFKKDMVFCEPYDGMKTPESMRAMAKHHGSRHVKVAFTGTGAMCIDVKKVLNRLAETTKQYQYPLPTTGFTHTHWEFFNEGSKQEEYMSEDWSFCHKVRDAGFDIVIDTEAHFTHTGQYTWAIPPPTPEAPLAPAPNP
jgi:hypothetical protein